MPYPAKAVANEFLALAKGENKNLTQMQLQKLVYFTYGWYLAITGARLIDERVEAWEWGPVIPSIYREFKRFGSSPVTEMAAEVGFRDGKAGYYPARVQSTESAKDELAMQVIRRVWDIYGKYSAINLSRMTHEPDSPWTLTPDKEIKGTTIDDAVIMEYFRRLAAKYERHT